MKCPICNKESFYEGNPSRPFCSDRCKLIDLGNWAAQKYSVPSNDKPPEVIHGANDDREN